MTSIAIIPARGGSKRIPRKNIREFRGEPIIAYSIKAAISSKLFDYIMVSTDDAEIANVSRRYGAEVPFLRSQNTANDFSTTADVMLEVVTRLRSESHRFDYACCIYATAPFVTADNLASARQILVEGKFNTVFPICEYNSPIFRSLKIDSSEKVSMIWPENMNVRSQDLPKAYHDAGQFYWLKTDAFLEERKLYSENSGCIQLDPMYVQDIDTELDWKIAEFKHTLCFPEK